MKKLKRHLTPQPPYILTPDGSIKMIWDLICLSVVIFEMVSIPFSISFDIDFSGDFANVSTGVFVFDIFLNFNTGVY
jgi:hyperpolarization activated cyclic nucleotide-gated potassium channel 2